MVLQLEKLTTFLEYAIRDAVDEIMSSLSSTTSTIDSLFFHRILALPFSCRVVVAPENGSHRKR